MHDEQKISIEPQLQPKMTDMLAQTVKTGIIKSNLIPMWAGLALALYHTQANIMDYIVQIILATIGSAAVIGSAGAFNNIYDRDIDAIMPRTQSRPTVTGQMPHFYAIAIRKHADYKAANIPMLPVAKGMKRTYYQTNFYLIILILLSFLFGSLSVGIMLVALLLSSAWLVMSIYGYHTNTDQVKWATKMFVFSLLHMTILFSTIIIYCLVGVIFKLY